MPEKDIYNIEQVPVQRSTTQVNTPNYELGLRERAKANAIKEHEELMEQYRKLPEVKVPEWFSLLQETAPEGPISNIFLNKMYNDIGKKLYEQKYNEYIEQHPLPKIAGTGYNPYTGIQYNPTVQQQQKAHDYAVKESGYVGDKSTEPYKEADKIFGEISVAGASMIPLFGASAGTLGVLPKLAADTYFGYEGVKGLTSPEGIAKTVNFIKQGRGGRAVLSGMGDLLDLAFIGQGLKGLKTLGAFARETPYIAKFNWMNRKSPFRMDYPWQRTMETLPERLALEYTADNQWDTAYDEALLRGDIAELQRLRDLHFKEKTLGNKLVNQNGDPHKVWHGSPEDWNVFDDWKRGTEDIIYFSTDKSYADQFTIPRKDWKVGMVPTKSSRSFYLYGKEPLDIGTDMDSQLVQERMRQAWLAGQNPDSAYGMDVWVDGMPLKQSNGIELGVLRRNQMKLSDPITYDDHGQIIPLSKRDDFTNPDIRFSKGNLTDSNIFAERYDGNPLNWDNINNDILTGKRAAIGYLNSKRKALTDQHNIDIAKRLFDVDITPEVNPGIRASIDMEPNKVSILQGTWYPKFGIKLTFDPKSTTKGNTVFNYKDPKHDEISLDLSSDLQDAALHEWLHRGNIAGGRDSITDAFYKWKNKKILKPEHWSDKYLESPQETADNLIEIGWRNGITNLEYPGFDKAVEKLREIINTDKNKGYLLDKTVWETKPKRVWDALQGKYMGLIPIGFGAGLIVNNNKNE